jgi:UDP-GlcNAc:undecaprenyl-phosphate GlcNAc-1-phosphate transferase
VVLITAFSVAVVATPLAMWLARRTGLLDHPGDLKVQSTAIPYLGGLGVAAGVVVGAAATRPAFILPLAMALALGVVDDARGVNAVVRLLAEVVIGVTIAALVPVRLPGPIGVLAVVLTTTA